MNFRKSGKLMWWGGIAGSILAVTGLLLKNETLSVILVVTGLLVYVAANVQSFFYYRCPHCGSSLRRAHIDVPRFCPECSEELPE